MDEAAKQKRNSNLRPWLKPWKKGQPSANPKGRPSHRVISNAVKDVLTEVDPRTQRSGAEQLARMMVQRAKQGSVKHLELILSYTEGRPAQKLSISGGVLHGHAWRPLASLTDEEVAQLAALKKKLSGPEEPAIEAEVIEDAQL
jgi:hypothetical protein